MECNISQSWKKLLPFALLTFFLTTATAQISLTADDIPGITIVRSDTVHGKALWGLINGGADIYFEYGFSNVTVQEISWNNFRFKAEIYTMQNDEAAFGIFSVSHHRCKSDTLAMWCCATPYQIQFAQGKCYVSVVNNSGTPAEQGLGRLISAKILEKISGKALTVPPIFNDTLFRQHTGRIKFIAGPLGIQNGYSSWEGKFTAIEKFKAYILPFETDSGFTVVSDIRFNNIKDTDQFSLNIPPTEPALNGANEKKGTMRYFKRIDLTSIIYLETDLPYATLIEYIKAVESLE